MSNIKILSIKDRHLGVEVFLNQQDFVTIVCSDQHDFIPVPLDISSAIRFSKELRKVIAEAKSAEK